MQMHGPSPMKNPCRTRWRVLSDAFNSDTMERELRFVLCRFECLHQRAESGDNGEREGAKPRT